MEQSTPNNIQPIDLMGIVNRVIKALRRLWFVVLALIVLGGGINYVRARMNYTPMYQSSTILSVSSGYSTGDIFSSTAYYDSSAAKQMAESFPYLLSSDMMRDLIFQQIGSTFYNGRIYYEAVTDTNLLQLIVRSSDPHDAYDILCALIDCYPQVAVYMVDNPQLIIRQAPVVPTEPYTSFSGTNSAIKGALAGLALGAVIIALQAMLIQPVTSLKELKKIVNLPVLATFPHVNRKKRSAPSSRVFINSDDDAGLAEALRGLRTKIHKQLSERGGRIVLLTSTIPGEGKSTISANLALSLASEGRSVVLVDADLRNQTVFRMFGAESAQMGLMDCMNNPELDVMECLRGVPGTGLFYLSGSSTRKRHYGIDTRSMRRILEQLTKEFDYVVMDTPPCTVVSDTALLSRFADCVLYVVRQDYANRSQIQDGITGLYERDIALTGCILNDVPRSRIQYGYGYGYSYGYGYGYGYGNYGSKYGRKSK